MAKHKRYHESKMARMHEEEGMERHLRGPVKHAGDGRHMYEPDERKMEKRSGAMLHEDHRAIANMPQDVKYHEWPSARMYLNTHLDDTIEGIEHQQMGDIQVANRHKPKSMY